MPRMKRLTPAELSPAPWPSEASDDEPAEAARLLAGALKRAIGTQSVSSVSRSTGVADGSILRIMKGQLWPDFVTVVRLEAGLQAELFPSYDQRARHQFKAIDPNIKQTRGPSLGMGEWSEGHRADP